MRTTSQGGSLGCGCLRPSQRTCGECVAPLAEDRVYCGNCGEAHDLNAPLPEARCRRTLLCRECLDRVFPERTP